MAKKTKYELGRSTMTTREQIREQITRGIIRAFLALPCESLPSATYVSEFEDGDPWSDLRNYMSYSDVATGVEIRLHADRPGWESVVVKL